ncbi:TolC family protein [Limisphaera ngatamarikiensis]|uniref:TolC family protein n=1 Tax=Limisphaera ngatamarikiensis TaxID=1324935 RepID=A0A6M1RSK2_9BACT|nr:TolC family protein [Limisphaera ngatamarikiensis]NGO40573.1 TolC family protein [Limisphaera ngatamarikiensis]
MRWRCIGALGFLTSMGMALVAVGEEVVDSADSDVSPAGVVLTLEEALRWACKHGAEVRLAMARLQEAQARWGEARLWPDPALEVAVEDGPVDRGRWGEESKQTVGVSQTIPLGGKKRLDVTLGRVGVELAEQERRMAVRALVREVKLAWVRALGSEEVLAAAAETVRVAEAVVKAVGEQVRAGAVGETDLVRAEMQLERARMELEEARRERSRARAVLAILVGGPGQGEFRLVGELRDGPDAALLACAPDEWLEQHPLMQRVKLEVRRAQVATARAAREKWPDVTLWVRGGRAGPADERLLEAGVTVPVPLWGLTRWRIEQARARELAAGLEWEVQRRQLLLRWEQECRRVEGASERLERLRREMMPRAERAVWQVRMAYEAGKLDLLALLDVQRTLAETRLAVARARLELNEAHVELEDLAGAIPVPEVEAPGYEAGAGRNGDGR